jgi:colicin import membrane protein
MHDLLVVEDLKPQDVFSGSGADAIIDRIEKEARSALIDISTDEGRKECASIAYKIARSKTFLDDMGKNLVAEWKTKSAKVDGERRRIRDRLDALKDEIRKPLTEFEDAEKNRVADHEARIAAMSEIAVIPDAQLATVLEIQGRLMALTEVMQRDWEEFGKRATEVADAARSSLQNQLAARQKHDADQAELARLRDEQVKRDQSDREARIKADAEAAAAKRAEQEIAAAKAREDAAIKAAQEAKDKAERDAKAAADKAERDAKEAAAKADSEAREAAAKADREKEAAIEAERARAAKVKSDEEAAAAKREADHKHKAKINREALAAISIAAGIPEDAAKPIVEAIARGAIPHVSIRY